MFWLLSWQLIDSPTPPHNPWICILTTVNDMVWTSNMVWHIGLDLGFFKAPVFELYPVFEVLAVSRQFAQFLCIYLPVFLYPWSLHVTVDQWIKDQKLPICSFLLPLLEYGWGVEIFRVFLEYLTDLPRHSLNASAKGGLGGRCPPPQPPSIGWFFRCLEKQKKGQILVKRHFKLLQMLLAVTTTPGKRF